MSDDRSTFETTRARLEDIVLQVRRKDVSLEQSLDMLEEAVRLVNQCNDLIDQTSFKSASEAAGGEEPGAVDAGADAGVAEPGPGPEAQTPAEPAQDTPETAGESEDAPAGASEAADEGADEGEDASVDTIAVVESFEVFDTEGEDFEGIEFVQFVAISEPATAQALEDDERA